METVKKGLWGGALLLLGMLISTVISDKGNKAFSTAQDGRYQLVTPNTENDNYFFIIDTATGEAKRFGYSGAPIGTGSIVSYEF